MLNRRHFIVSTAALAAASPVDAKSLDPLDKNIKFGTTGSIFGTWPNAGAQNSISMKMSTDMPLMLKDIKHYGLQGFEPYAPQVTQYLDKPLELKNSATRSASPLSI